MAVLYGETTPGGVPRRIEQYNADASCFVGHISGGTADFGGGARWILYATGRVRPAIADTINADARPCLGRGVAAKING